MEACARIWALQNAGTQTHDAREMLDHLLDIEDWDERSCKVDAEPLRLDYVTNAMLLQVDDSIEFGVEFLVKIMRTRNMCLSLFEAVIAPWLLKRKVTFLTMKKLFCFDSAAFSEASVFSTS